MKTTWATWTSRSVARARASPASDGHQDSGSVARSPCASAANRRATDGCTSSTRWRRPSRRRTRKCRSTRRGFTAPGQARPRPRHHRTGRQDDPRHHRTDRCCDRHRGRRHGEHRVPDGPSAQKAIDIVKGLTAGTGSRQLLHGHRPPHRRVRCVRRDPAGHRWTRSHQRAANERVHNVSDVVKEGDEVMVKVIGIDRTARFGCRAKKRSGRQARPSPQHALSAALLRPFRAIAKRRTHPPRIDSRRGFCHFGRWG